MSERKNIDKLFQEQFKDFEATAPEASWPIIEEKLRKKKDRKVIPFWWKLSGIAAALLLGFIISDNYFNGKPGIDNRVVIEEKTTRDSSVSKRSQIDNAAEIESAVTNSEKTNPILNQENDSLLQNKNPESIGVNPKSNIKSTANRSGLVSNENAKPDLKNSHSSDKIKTHKKHSKFGIQQHNESIVFNPSVKTKGKSNPIRNSNVTDQNQLSPDSEKDKLQTALPDKSYIKRSDAAIANQNKNFSNSETPENNSLNNQLANEKTPIAAAMITNPDKKLDSTAIATVVPNALEELLNEKENNLITQEPHLNRWQITSSVAPIYFGSASNGSPIDSTFAGNSKDYKTNVSIGLGVHYAINKKLSIRTGISQVSFNYNTNDVLIYAGLQPNSLDNVTVSTESQFINFEKKTTETGFAAEQSELETDKFQSYINQRMGYIEVPLEMSYSLIDKKFGVNIIGGISTLFLNENKIVIVSSGSTSNLGEANNLSKTHFSSNIGLGLKYRFFKAFQANFEPMFKYQINTFNKDAGNFKPYFFALYTGLSYSF